MALPSLSDRKNMMDMVIGLMLSICCLLRLLFKFESAFAVAWNTIRVEIPLNAIYIRSESLDIVLEPLYTSLS
jgi:hypothetical protein